MTTKTVELIKEDLLECVYGEHIIDYAVKYMSNIYIKGSLDLFRQSDITQALKEFLNENY